MRHILAVLVLLTLLAAACSSSDGDDGSAAESSNADESSSDSGDESPSDDPASEEDTVDESAASSGGGSGTAELTLSNGDSFSFSVLCTLEPQTAAGQEILFTATSYDTPYHFDVTQFGEDASNIASVSVYDAETFETVWQSNSIYGNEISLSVEGSSIVGSGQFQADDELDSETVDGELVVNC